MLLIIVTLICVYLACWEPTRTRGVKDVHKFLQAWPRLDHTLDVSATLPLIVRVRRWEHQTVGSGHSVLLNTYYVWFFGHVAKLFDQELERTWGLPPRQWKTPDQRPHRSAV